MRGVRWKIIFWGAGGGGKSGDESGMLFDWETEWNAIGGKAHCEIVKRYI